MFCRISLGTLALFVLYEPPIDIVKYRDLTRAEFEACRKDALDALKCTVEEQQHPLYTQNYEYLGSERTKWRNRFAAASSGGFTPFNHDHKAEYQEELNLMVDVSSII